MIIYKIKETPRAPGGPMWTLFRQESDNAYDLMPVSMHETKDDAEATQAVLERRDAEAAE
jgi:hypothetical protein